VSRGALSEVAEPSAQAGQRGGSMPGLVWAMLPLRRLSAPLRVLVVGSALLAPIVPWRLASHETAWLSTSVYQMLLLTVVVCSALVPAAPALGERLWPLSVRQIFVVHVAQRVLLGLGPFVLMSLLVWGVRALPDQEIQADALIGGVGDLVGLPWFETAAVLMVACLLPFLSLPSPLAIESESRMRRMRLMFVSCAWLLVALQWLGEPWRLLVPSTAALLAVPLAWWQWRAAFTPAASAACEYDRSEAVALHGESPSFSPANAAVSGTYTGVGTARTTVTAIGEVGPGLLDTWKVVWALSPTRWYLVFGTVFYLPMVGFSAFHGFRNSVSMFAGLVPVVLMLLHSRALSVLPVHPWRRLQVAVLMFPLAITIALALGLGLRQRYKPQVTHTQDAPFEDSMAGDWNNPSRVQLAYWRWSGADQPPLVVAPWGEKVEPFAARVLGLWLYNPFTVRDESSEAFQRWQWQRLTTAVYGQVVPREEFKKRNRQRPTMRSERWPVLILRTAFTQTMLLLFTLSCWKVRTQRFRWRELHWSAAFYIPIALPIAAGSLAEGLGLGLVPGVVDQLLMGLAARLPTDPLALSASLVTLTTLPALAALALLRRASLQPVLEFAAGSEVGRRGPWG